MGVMACYRNNCNEIMCHILVCGHYLCVDCYNELLKYKETWPDKMKKKEIEEYIYKFLNSEKETFCEELNEDEIEEEFKNHIIIYNN